VTPPGSLGSTISGRIDPEDTTIEDIARRLNEIRYQVERRQVQAIRREEPIWDDLEEQLQQEWRLLCMRAGFDEDEFRPPLPAPVRTLLLSPAQVYQEIVIAHNRGTLISPRVSEVRLGPITAPTSPLGPPPASLDPSPAQNLGSGPSETTRAGQHRAILGDPALPMCIAEL